MRLAGIPVGGLTTEHIAALPENKVGESRTLEFKLTLPGNSSGDKKEFLADVSALANSAGGVIVYGVETERDEAGHDTGVARAVVGLRGINVDKEKLRISAMLHDGIAPSLASHIALQDVSGPVQDAPVIALGVSQSLARPHMITFEKSGKFWRRSDTGKYQPDIEELRSMFREADAWIEEAEAFREQRIQAVLAVPLPIPTLKCDSSVFVHVLPLGRLDRLISLKNHLEHLRTALRPLGEDYSGYSFRFNADGYLIQHDSGNNQILAYSQWFRFGGVEGYDSWVVGSREAGAGQQLPSLFANEIVKDVRAYLPRALAAMNGLGIEPPHVVMISLLGITGSRILYGRHGELSEPITRDSILLPPIVLEDENSNVLDQIGPLFDIIYQAGGLTGAPAQPAAQP